MRVQPVSLTSLENLPDEGEGERDDCTTLQTVKGGGCLSSVGDEFERGIQEDRG